MRRLLVVLIALAILRCDVGAQARFRRRTRSGHVATAVGGSVLTMSDLACVGMFLGPAIEPGVFSANYPTAVRLVGGVAHIFQYDGKSNVYEYLIPTITGNCSTAIGSLAQASILQAWGAWPTPHSGDSNAWTPRNPNNNATYMFGLYWDDTNSWLVGSWSSTYNSLVNGSNAIGAVTLNTGPHTLSCVGEWGVTGVKQSAIGTGIISIPATFLSTYSLGTKRWGLGLGGYTSSGSNGATANSIGMALRATDVPSGNPCLDATDTDIAEGTTLVRHDLNESGPTCNGNDADQSGIYINCTPGSGTPSTSISPTTPYPQQVGYNKYSQNFYRFTWDPYAGHGWVGAGTTIRSDWYDHATKPGIVSVMQMPSGSVNTPVLASPAPTISGCPSACHATFSLDPSALTGNHALQVGDKVWVQTCSPIVFGSPGDPCAVDNGRYLSTVKLTNVNNATGAMECDFYDFDYTAGPHTPIVGGYFFMGGAYVHGGPDNSREIDIIQITDPAQLGQVKNGTRNSWDVVYNEEAEFSTFAAPFGCPGCGTPGKDPVKRQNVSAVHAIPSQHRILVAFRNGVIGIGSVQTLFVVLSAP